MSSQYYAHLNRIPKAAWQIQLLRKAFTTVRTKRQMRQGMKPEGESLPQKRDVSSVLRWQDTHDAQA